MIFNNRIAVFGHRGCIGREPENTLKSFSFAVNSKADGIELDVRLSRDGTPFVFHDMVVDRLTDEKGFFKYFSDDDIADLRVMGEPIPTLNDVLDHLESLNVNGQAGFRLNVEVKDESAIESVANALKSRHKWLPLQFIISSFDQHAIIRANQYMPAYEKAICLAGTPIDYAACMVRAKAHALHLDHDGLSRHLVQDVLARGGQVRVYTVNDPAHIQGLVDVGVSAIFTDVPDVMTDVNA